MFKQEETAGRWEKRWHPLLRQWIIYAAHRNSRPWNTGTQEVAANDKPAYDPGCYLCPGNKRVSGNFNPPYQDVFVFDNDHPVVGHASPEVGQEAAGVFKRGQAYGVARVVCYDPRHNISMVEAGVETVEKVMQAWQLHTHEIARDERIKNILVFENKGELVGVSNPHPHCQIYATDFVFNGMVQQLENAALYQQEHGSNLFDDLLRAEQEDGRRIIFENEQAIAFIPFFARYAYEVMLFPKRRVQHFDQLEAEEIKGLAEAYHAVISRFDAIYNMSFPYTMTLHQAPVNLGKSHPDFHLYFLFLPPLRQPGLQKFLGGPESGLYTFMADTMPEEKAPELRDALNPRAAGEAAMPAIDPDSPPQSAR